MNQSPLRLRLAPLLCVVGFYWLLRPAEYLHTAAEGRSQAFRLADIHFTVDATTTYVASDPSLNDLDISRISRATLTFNDQKNAVRGKKISHSVTNDPTLCPYKALVRICAHLGTHDAPPATPIHTYYDGLSQPHHATPTLIANALRHAATDVRAVTGIDPSLLSARSLRPGGATALLCADVDPETIQLLGRWKSDAMLRYLRVAAHANHTNFAQRMLTAGAYTFAPNTCTAAHIQPLPVETPAAFITALQRAELYQP